MVVGRAAAVAFLMRSTVAYDGTMLSACCCSVSAKAAISSKSVDVLSDRGTRDSVSAVNIRLPGRYFISVKLYRGSRIRFFGAIANDFFLMAIKGL